jgi:hypothetical protein
VLHQDSKQFLPMAGRACGGLCDDGVHDGMIVAVMQFDGMYYRELQNPSLGAEFVAQKKGERRRPRNINPHHSSSRLPYNETIHA